MRFLFTPETLGDDPKTAARRIAEALRAAHRPGKVEEFFDFLDHLIYACRDAVFGLPRQPFRRG